MDWQEILIEPTRQMLIQIGGFVVNILGMIAILIVGWLIAKLIKRLVTRLLRVVQLDKAAEHAGIDKFLAKGGISYSLAQLVGLLCYWLALLVVVVVAINAMGLGVAAELLNRIVLYIPNVIVSIFILVLGMFVATFFGAAVTTAASNAGIDQSRLLGKIVEVVVIVFSVAIALEQLRIGADLIRLCVTVILASFGLGLAIAFGLGCKDIVGKFVADSIDKLKSKR